ncbi:GIY-YIG nuclease family protein [Mesohalobacter halotolerans]|jgi:putative endonuclease|uniref:GIY-YIG nuclease family protein n=1 Tax=Mesohalobacter halotolerans TaxID=1883405 RepID=A0A4U5TRN7_9FLAO|nr:GIY-YIG nuclease family protein [Mesohalobacter halotolerans]MBS3737697.1 GIY-YIG nuclease family protein [Psychroflexus sp.]NBC56902.1 GIY-YIG nuclease family protein [Bacteroidota bacterium]TKS56481.1 GIY-YIG nuclease family protein [Mesohalobacter halotolerans]
MFYVYVLYSKKFDRYYVGMTVDIERRLSEHNSGKMISTKAYKPWIIAHFEVLNTRKEARKREKYLKSSAGRRWRKQNIKIDIDDKVN